jgi:hypothetical protein
VYELVNIRFNLNHVHNGSRDVTSVLDRIRKIISDASEYNSIDLDDLKNE